jgi:ORF6N domain
MPTKSQSLIPVDAIAKRITLIRNQRVIIDADLAALYGVSTSAFNQAIKRNQTRFPDDFMFQLSRNELEFWRSQIVMSNTSAKMGLRRAPYAFTEHGA